MDSTRRKGFTLLELLVSIASSTVIIGGFFIAFASLDRVSKQTDQETRNIARSNNVRILIHKILAGASTINFRSLESDGENYDVLYYYKYDKDAAGVEQPVEYGYFFVDQPLDTEPSFRVAYEADGSQTVKDHLFYRRVVGSPSSPVAQLEAEDFDYTDPSRFVVMEDVENFYAKVEYVDTDTGLASNKVAPEQIKRYNVDYQITAAYDTGFYTLDSTSTAQREQQRTIFKGSTYAVGRVTEG